MLLDKGKFGFLDMWLLWLWRYLFFIFFIIGVKTHVERANSNIKLNLLWGIALGNGTRSSTARLDLVCWIVPHRFGFANDVLVALINGLQDSSL